MAHSSPLVSVCCITYNHEDHISKAIEGFLMQKTDFPIEIIIHDDASTDRTADIIRSYEEKYPNLIKPIYQKTNQYSLHKRMIMYPISKAQGKYIALCEGDDYWTDPYKLQKQVDYLESNPDCTICTHACRYVYLREGNREIINRASNGNMKFYAEEALELLPYPGVGHTSSIVFPKRIIKELPQWYFQTPMGDQPLKLICAHLGHGYYIDEAMSTHLIGTKGSFTERILDVVEERINFIKGYIKMYENFKTYTNGKYRRLIHKEIARLEMGVENFTRLNAYAKKFGFENFNQFIERLVQHIKKNRIEKIGIFGTAFVASRIYEYLLHNGVQIQMYLDNYRYGRIIDNVFVHHPQVLSIKQYELDLVINSVLGEHSIEINKQLQSYDSQLKILSKEDLLHV